MDIEIIDTCTCCGFCEAINSKIFNIKKTVIVNKEFIKNNENDCLEAALSCPVNAIKLK